MLSEQEDLKEHVPLHMARLQQMEAQVKSSSEKKDQKLNEIIKFIQESVFTSLNEDSVLKFYGQKNSSTSTDKENQSTKTFVFFNNLSSVTFDRLSVKWINGGTG